MSDEAAAWRYSGTARSILVRHIIYLAFFTSGACALIYQVAWIRVLTADFGTTVYALSAVLTVFMAGLALGSYLLGQWVDRAGAPLLLYAGLEFALAVYAWLFVLSTETFHHWYAHLFQSGRLPASLSLAAGILLAFGILLLPTTLMGGTWPVVARWISDAPDVAQRRLPTLYGVNVAGAVVGCLAAAYVLILLLGVKGSILLAAVTNALLGVIATAVHLYQVRQVARSPACSAPNTAVSAVGSPDTAGQPERTAWQGRLRILAFSSGFVVLATEILWTRLLITWFSANVLVYATIIAGFLTGMALASFAVALWPGRVPPAETMLGLILLGGALCLVGSLFCQVPVAACFQLLQERLGPGALGVQTYVCLTALYLSVALAATILGALFPLLLRCVNHGLSSLGREVGGLYAVNTVGSIAGALLTGFVLIAVLGTGGSLMLLACGYLALSFWLSASAVRLASGALLLAGIVLLCLPATRRPVYWMNHGFDRIARVPEDRVLFLEEGVQCTVGVARLDHARGLTVNGLIVAETSPDDLWDLLLKAHLPMLLHPHPEQVALIGLGAGISLGAVVSYGEVEHIDCIELSAGVVRAHRQFARYNQRCWEDDRLSMHIGDGRHFLLATPRRYHVLSVDPVDPPVCDLYTGDFFQLCHDRLQQGGLMVQWLPLFRMNPQHLLVVIQAFHQVFPHTTLWYDGTSVLLIGCRGRPLEINLARVLGRMQQPRVQRNLAMIGSPVAHWVMSSYVTGGPHVGKLVGDDVPQNTDDQPYLEYMALRAARPAGAALAANLQMLLRHEQPIESRLRNQDRTTGNLQLLRRGQSLKRDLLQVRIRFLQGELDQGELLLQQVVSKYSLTDSDLERLGPFLRGVLPVAGVR